MSTPVRDATGGNFFSKFQCTDTNGLSCQADALAVDDNELKVSNLSFVSYDAPSMKSPINTTDASSYEPFDLTISKPKDQALLSDLSDSPQKLAATSTKVISKQEPSIRKLSSELLRPLSIETESQDNSNKDAPSTPLTILWKLCEQEDGNYPRTPDQSVPTSDEKDAKGCDENPLNRSVFDFSTDIVHEITFEPSESGTPTEEKDSELKIYRVQTNFDNKHDKTRRTPSKKTSFHTLVQRLTPKKYRGNKIRFPDEPVTSSSENEEDEERNDHEVATNGDTYDTDFFDSETVVAKNTAPKETATTRQVSSKWRFFDFFRLNAAATTGSGKSKDKISAVLWLRRQETQEHALLNRSTSNSSAGLRRRRFNCKLDIPSLLILLIVFAEIIIMSTIGTTYLGATVALQKFNFTKAITEAQIHNAEQNVSEQIGQDGSNSAPISNSCKPNESLLQFEIVFDSNPSDVGIILDVTEGNETNSLWNFRPMSAFQAPVLAGRANVFTICLSKFEMYTLKIIDKSCNGLSSLADIGELTYGKWNVKSNGIPLVRYSGNCTQGSDEQGGESLSLTKECGHYSACIYKISNTGFFGSCSARSCSVKTIAKTFSSLSSNTSLSWNNN